MTSHTDGGDSPSAPSFVPSPVFSSVLVSDAAAVAASALPNWRTDGVCVVRGDQLDTNTPQTPGMNRAAAINHARVGAQKLWAGTVTIHPNAKTGAHHHGALESVIYVIRGRARMRWGDQLEFTAEAGPGDFIYVPPYVPHQEINASQNEASNACWCAATMMQSSLISTSPPSNNRSKCCGSIRFTAIRIRTTDRGGTA